MHFNQSIRLGAATLNQTPIDWANNLANIQSAIALAKEGDVDLLLLPELCICGYGCEDLFLADWLLNTSLEKLSEIVPLTKGIAVSIGLPIKWEGIIYNCACLISDGRIMGFSAKQHLANDGVHYEHRWFRPWPSQKQSEIAVNGVNYPIGDLVYELLGLKIAYEICEDMWHEEARPAAFHCQKGVQVILNPSASPFTFGKTKRREKIIVDSTINYDCTYVYANILGNESGRIIFDGELFIATEGKVVAQNRRFSFEQVNVMSHSFSLVDGRLKTAELATIAACETKETEFYKAASLGLFDYLRKSRSKSYVLSLSGGADSTACAVLVRTMIDLGINELGLDNFVQKAGIELLPNERTPQELTKRLLFCAYQGTENSSNDTLTSAKEVATELGATFYHWNIDDALHVYTSKIESAVGQQLSWQTHDVALQNIQARVRAPFIWFLTNLKNGLLLTTSNRSEGDVGYCTMDGDTAGGLAPIAGVDKSFVQHWLRWAEVHLGFRSLSHVNQLAPSAELRPLAERQTDESDLMPYALMVQIEELAIFNRLSVRDVFETLKTKAEYSEADLRKFVGKFFRLWQRNQWKRERLAPGFHLDEFNVDPKTWCRFPILGGGFEEELRAVGL